MFFIILVYLIYWCNFHITCKNPPSDTEHLLEWVYIINLCNTTQTQINANIKLNIFVLRINDWNWLTDYQLSELELNWLD